MYNMSHHEIHRTHRVGWLRAAVLGANEGIVSTASLIIGVAAASTSHSGVLLAGVADQLMAHDALGAHARDEIGISEIVSARPVQAALSSAGTFIIGALLPILVAWAFPGPYLILAVALSSLFFLAFLGSLAARTGGASVITGAARLTFWGALAMALTAGAGRMFGVVASKSNIND